MFTESLATIEEGYSYLFKDPLDKNNFNTANDFDLAIEDIRFLNIFNVHLSYNNHEKYKEQFNNLHHFSISRPSYYNQSTNSFSTYLTFYLILMLCKEQEMSLKKAEKIFTEQLFSFVLKNNENITKELQQVVLKNWKISEKILQNFVRLSYTYKKVSTNSMVRINCIGLSFKIHIPLVGYVNEDEVDIIYYSHHREKRPAWYTIPSIFKIYNYFLERGLKIRKFYFYSFDLLNFSIPNLICIPYTPNVSKLIERYRNIQPYPYPNIFKKDKHYYNNKPLSILLNE